MLKLKLEDWVGRIGKRGKIKRKEERKVERQRREGVSVYEEGDK